MLSKNKLQNKVQCDSNEKFYMCMCVFVCVHTHIIGDQKNIHQNVNSGIMGDVYIFLRGFLNLPNIIHINIFSKQEKNLPNL